MIILIAIGVSVGVVVSKNNSNNNRASSNKGSSAGEQSGSTTTSTGKGPTTTSTSTSGDPSVFEKDPNLHRSFYGMAYTPDGSLLPNCGSTLGALFLPSNERQLIQGYRPDHQRCSGVPRDSIVIYID